MPPPPARKLTPSEVRQTVGEVKAENGGSFPTNRLFRRFLERRLEWEAHEEEAITRNIPLAEVEESRRRTKRRSEAVLRDVSWRKQVPALLRGRANSALSLATSSRFLNKTRTFAPMVCLRAALALKLGHLVK